MRRSAWPHYWQVREGSLGVCRFDSACHKCGKERHFARDCRQLAPVQDMRIFYHFHQVGHVKTNCPQLAARPAQALVPATLKITNRGQGRAEPPKAQGRAFQLAAKGARTTPDAVTSMFLPLILLHMIIL